jgi:hypothetical protein
LGFSVILIGGKFEISSSFSQSSINSVASHKADGDGSLQEPASHDQASPRQGQNEQASRIRVVPKRRNLCI